MVIGVQLPVGLHTKLPSGTGADLAVQGKTRRTGATAAIPAASLRRYEHRVEVVQIGVDQRRVVLPDAGLNGSLVIAKQVVDDTDPWRPVMEARYSLHRVAGDGREVPRRHKPAR